MYEFVYIRLDKNKIILNLCDDCVGACFSRLLSDEKYGSTNFEKILTYINYEAKKS